MITMQRKQEKYNRSKRGTVGHPGGNNRSRFFLSNLPIAHSSQCDNILVFLCVGFHIFISIISVFEEGNTALLMVKLLEISENLSNHSKRLELAKDTNKSFQPSQEQVTRVTTTRLTLDWTLWNYVSVSAFLLSHLIGADEHSTAHLRSRRCPW